ncbi:DUF4825 domain-containing protein [Salimicrobium sp. PL1-032A]|uniref:DUF4825 domain-containing protein n=1 Tax=Salimicrobium sp. PL1-032A TaxID=3095364 RepID=UPI003260400A
MKKPLFAAFLLLTMSGCMSDTQAKDLFDYEGTMIGNNSDVHAIVQGLENGAAVEEIELHTNEEPYGLTIRYDGVPDEEIDRWTRENAGRLFILIDNVRNVEMELPSRTRSFSKQAMEKETGKRFDEIATINQWKEVQEWIN